MAITDSLDAATQQVTALLAQLKLSNCRVLQGQDTGAADAVTVAPVPGVSSYGPDLVLVVDVANTNKTTSPTIAVSQLGAVPIRAASGSGGPAVGSIFGKCIFTFSSVAGGGYIARVVAGGSLGITAAVAQQVLSFVSAQQIFSITNQAAPGSGLAATLARPNFMPTGADSSTLSATFTAPAAGTVQASSILISTPQNGFGNSVEIDVNGTAVATNADSIAGLIINVAAATVNKGDTVTVKGTVSSTQAAQYNTTQRFTYSFIPS